MARPPCIAVVYARFMAFFSFIHIRNTHLIGLLALFLALVPAASPTSVSAAPLLWLPTPPGETWQIIQGYNCGTHNSYDRYSIDLVNRDGETTGSPVRAAADGEVFVWAAASGTLILRHGGGFYTQYTHMQSAVSTSSGKTFKQGDIIGRAGSRGSPSVPHLHFMAFTAEGSGARNRQTVPLSFADGYDLPDTGSCNANGGTKLVAKADFGAMAEGVAFHTDAATGSWYSGDYELKFDGQGLLRGYSVAWNHDPGGDQPAVTDKIEGTALLSEAGEGLNTLFVRSWDRDGNQLLTQYGPIGYDVTPPDAPPTWAEPLTIAPDTATPISWTPGQDAASGIAGYRVYLGDNPEGTSEWFVEGSAIDAPPLAAGTYLLRVQPLDFAGNNGAWSTIGTVIVAAE